MYQDTCRYDKAPTFDQLHDLTSRLQEAEQTIRDLQQTQYAASLSSDHHQHQHTPSAPLSTVEPNVTGLGSILAAATMTVGAETAPITSLPAWQAPVTNPTSIPELGENSFLDAMDTATSSGNMLARDIDANRERESMADMSVDENGEVN